MKFSEISKTSILTLICRVVGTKKRTIQFHDPEAIELYNLIYTYSTRSERQWMSRLEKKFRGLSRKSVKVICRRARVIDKIANEFIKNNPSGTVISLGCGFDTRFWRALNGSCRYIELDLPEVMNLKTKLIEDKIDYNCLGISVLDTSWIEDVTKKGNENFLIIAEGLFMYLPKEEVVKLIQKIAIRFNNSTLVFDSVHEKYTKGIWKWFTNWNWRIVLDIDFKYTYGIKNPLEIESYAKDLKATYSEQINGYLISVSINNNHD